MKVRLAFDVDIRADDPKEAERVAKEFVWAIQDQFESIFDEATPDGEHKIKSVTVIFEARPTGF